MQLEVGKIYEGKVTGITKFGAFVEVDAKTTGMVHISEVANTFVNEIKDHIQEGQTVKVKVMSISDDGKIAMSIKKAMPQQQNNNSGGFQKRPNQGGGNFVRKDNNFNRQNNSSAGEHKPAKQPAQYSPSRSTLGESGDSSFEDMLSKFKASSEEKISDMKRVKENKRRSNSHRK